MYYARASCKCRLFFLLEKPRPVLSLYLGFIKSAVSAEEEEDKEEEDREEEDKEEEEEE